MHRYSVRAGYGDTDQSGIIHHGVYLRWLEEARTSWLRELGMDFRELEQDQRVGFAVARADLRYKRPALFDDELTIEVRIGKMRGATLRFDYRILRAEELLTTAEVTLACIDLDRMRPIRMPFLSILPKA